MFYSELIIGTTASGKSAYAIEAARKLKGIVLSIDSVSVYRQLNIGTAKPSKEILNEIPHYCINIADIDKPFSAIAFRREALRVIEYAQKEEIPLLITAGSFFYLKALLTEPNLVPQTEPGLEKNLESRIELEGIESLYEELKSVDLKSAEKIHPHDRYRIIRALAIFKQTNKPLSEYKSNDEKCFPRPAWIKTVKLLDADKAELEKRIKARTEIMLKNGLIEEVDALLKGGYQATLRPLQSVGYKEVLSFLKGKVSKNELPDLIKRSTQKLAKRQRTWIRNGIFPFLN